MQFFIFHNSLEFETGFQPKHLQAVFENFRRQFIERLYTKSRSNSYKAAFTSFLILLIL